MHLDELIPLSWTVVEKPLGAGVVEGCVGMVRGRITRVARAEAVEDGAVGLVVGQKKRGQNVTSDFVLHPLGSLRSSPTEWRILVPDSEVTEVRRITATTVWRGEERIVEGVSEADGVLYHSGTSADLGETTPLAFTSEPVEPANLPSVTWPW